MLGLNEEEEDDDMYGDEEDEERIRGHRHNHHHHHHHNIDDHSSESSEEEDDDDDFDNGFDPDEVQQDGLQLIQDLIQRVSNGEEVDDDALDIIEYGDE